MAAWDDSFFVTWLAKEGGVLAQHDLVSNHTSVSPDRQWLDSNASWSIALYWVLSRGWRENFQKLCGRNGHMKCGHNIGGPRMGNEPHQSRVAWSPS